MATFVALQKPPASVSLFTTLKVIRHATIEDLDALVELENASFSEDRMSRENYRHLLKRGHASVLVDEDHQKGALRGSAVVLYRKGLAAARLYSIAVSPENRGQKRGRALLEAALDDAVENECLALRLEVRPDNHDAIALYERYGFRKTGSIEDYYEDGSPALRYERVAVEQGKPPRSLSIPYYEQTLDFTCGAACLLMAIKYFHPKDVKFSRAHELELWREATTIFMTSGIGGCSAQGLAVAALRRNLHATVYSTTNGVPFIDSVRSTEKKEVLRIVHRSFEKRLAETGHPVILRDFGKKDLIEAIDRGIIPIVLVSGYRLYGEKAPHWVVVTGYDEHFVYIHDPYIPHEEPSFDGRHVPIHEQDFMYINRYGKAGSRAMVLISA